MNMLERDAKLLCGVSCTGLTLKHRRLIDGNLNNSDYKEIDHFTFVTRVTQVAGTSMRGLPATA